MAGARLAAVLVLSGCASPLTRHATPAGRAAGWITTPDRTQLLAPMAGVTVHDTATMVPGATVITVDATQQFQAIAGFGAAITDASAELIQQRLTPQARTALLQELFGRGPQDAGFGVVRLTIGASDFSRTHYTLDDVPAGTRDAALQRFSLAPMERDVLPVVRAARAVRPELVVIATPWSAPAWMKTSGSLVGGTLRSDAFDAYARYLDRTLTALETAGVPVALLTVQNEPHHEPKDYPGMRFLPLQRAQFVGEHLGPLLARRKARTRVLDWDHNWDEPASPLTVLHDAVARPFIAGVAWHCYAGDVAAQTQVHDAHPTLETWFTECAGGEWAPNFGDNLRWNVRTLIIGTMRHWARGVTLWNLALDTQHGPRNGGCANCRGVITIDSASGSITRNEEYYALAHASRFVQAGARRIASTSDVDGVQTVAFANPDGTRVLVVAGADAGARTLRIRDGTTAIHATVAAGAIVTLRWR